MTGRQAKGVLLDKFVEVTGYERKYAIKVLGDGLRYSFSRYRFLRLGYTRSLGKACQIKGKKEKKELRSVS